MDKPRILFDARWINTQRPDGITRVSRELIRALTQKAQLGLLVVHAEQAAGFGTSDIHLAPTPQRLLKSRRELGRILRDQDYDAYFNPHYLQLRPRTQTRIILFCHDLTPWLIKSQSASLFWRVFHSSYFGLKVFLKGANIVVTGSKASKGLIQQLIPKKPIEVIYHGVDSAFSQLKLAKPQKKLLYVGRFEPYKNVESLISAMAQLPDYRLACIGSVDDSRRQALSALDTASQVNFLGPVTDKRYCQEMSQAHALVMPSLSEGFGLPVAEAMTARTPVICSDIPVLREVGGRAPIFVEPTDIAGYVKAVRQLENPSVRRECIEAGERQARKFDWSKSADAIVALCTIDRS